MFIVFLTYTNQKHLAAEFMQSHMDWIASGINDNIFLLVGSLVAGKGGCILAHNISRNALMQQLNLDPFIEHNVVSADIVELDAKIADKRLQFLMN